MKDLTHAMYYEMAGADNTRVKTIVWGRYLSRQRFNAEQTRPHWRVYGRDDIAAARALSISQAEGNEYSGMRMVVAPIIVAVDEALRDECEKSFADKKVPPRLRGIFERASETTRRTQEQAQADYDAAKAV